MFRDILILSRKTPIVYIDRYSATIYANAVAIIIICLIGRKKCLSKLIVLKVVCHAIKSSLSKSSFFVMYLQRAIPKI